MTNSDNVSLFNFAGRQVTTLLCFLGPRERMSQNQRPQRTAFVASYAGPRGSAAAVPQRRNAEERILVCRIKQASCTVNTHLHRKAPTQLLSVESARWPGGMLFSKRQQRHQRQRKRALALCAEAPHPGKPQLLVQRAAAFAGRAAVLGLLCYLQFLLGNGSFSIMDNTEPKFAVCAKNMLRTGNWLIPQWNGRVRFDKPPLVYWLQAVAYRLFGFTESATRLPTALAACAVTLMMYCFSVGASSDNMRKRQFKGLISAAAFACSLYAVGWARSGVSDMVLCAWITACLGCFAAAYISETKATRFAWYIGMFAAAALALLTKGPLGVALPALIVNVFLVLVGQWRAVVLHEIPWTRGVLLAAAIGLPWYMLIIRAYGLTYIKAFFGYHNLARLTSAVNAHSGPWYYYLACLLLGFLPWVAALPVALVAAYRRSGFAAASRKSSRREQIPLFITTWFLLTISFFSCIRTKLFSYILPAIPAAALLIGEYFSGVDPRKPADCGRAERLITALAVIIIMAAMALLCLRLESLIIGSSGGAGDPWILRVCLEQVRAQKLVWRGVAPWVLGIVGVLVTCSISRWYRYLPTAMAASFMLFQCMFLLPAIRVWDRAHQQPLRELAQCVRSLRERSEADLRTDRVYMMVFGWCDGVPEGQPSVVWYSDFDGWHFAERPEETLADIVLMARRDDRAERVCLVSRPAADVAPNYASLWSACCDGIAEDDLRDAKDVLILADTSIWRTIPGQLPDTKVIERRGPFALYRVPPRAALRAVQAIRNRGGTYAFQRDRLDLKSMEPASNMKEYP